jgi:hypothetical protein
MNCRLMNRLRRMESKRQKNGLVRYVVSPIPLERSFPRIGKAIRR